MIMRTHQSGLGVAQLSTDYCKSYWSLLNPLAWFGGCAGPDIADVYQKVQYGTAPPAVVEPPAPTVALTTDSTVPGAVYAGQAAGVAYYAVPSTPAENQAALIAKQNAAIDAAIAAGYNPAGKLPLKAIDLDKFWGPILLAVLAVLFLSGGRR